MALSWPDRSPPSRSEEVALRHASVSTHRKTHESKTRNLKTEEEETMRLIVLAFALGEKEFQNKRRFDNWAFAKSRIHITPGDTGN